VAFAGLLIANTAAQETAVFSTSRRLFRIAQQRGLTTSTDVTAMSIAQHPVRC
jgi:hypothetical protein